LIETDFDSERIVISLQTHDPYRYRDAMARRNYAAASPVTHASGKRKAVMARYVHNGRLVDALHGQAFAALTASPGARAFCDQRRRRTRTQRRSAQARQPARRILHGCLKTRTVYDEDAAWGHRQQHAA